MKMKKILITTLLLLFLVFTVKAQKSPLIIGKWVFTKALNKEVDAAGLAYMKAEVIGKWKMEFLPDGKFYTHMAGEKESGEWKLNTETNTLVIRGMEGGPQQFKILKSTENELSLKLGLGAFLLTRIIE